MALWLQSGMPTDELSSVGSGVMDYLKLLLVLCGILVLAYVTLRFVIPRMMGMNPGGAGPIQILARYPLEPKKTLYAVQVGADVLLIGSSESGLQLLKELDPSTFAATAQPLDAARSSQFTRVLENLRGRKTSS